MTSNEAAERELIEALAWSLYRAYPWNDGPGWEREEERDRDAWRCVAKETLRQMQWAQRRGIRYGLVCRGLREGLVTDSSSGKAEISTIAKHDPLTLAPKDWTP